MQVALIVIMAQIGCHVPAKAASLSCVDRLFTQFGTGDSVETNSSSFMMEMKVPTLQIPLIPILLPNPKYEVTPSHIWEVCW